MPTARTEPRASPATAPNAGPTLGAAMGGAAMGRPVERPARPGPAPAEAWYPPPPAAPRGLPRRRAWWLLAVPALLAIGGVGGFVLGVWLELPPQAGVHHRATAPADDAAPAVPDTAAGPVGELATLRDLLAGQAARLEAAERARALAEQQLAEALQALPAPTPPPRARPGAGPPAAALAPPGAQPAIRRGPRVVVSFPAGSPQGQEAAQAVGATLRDAGTEGVELRGLLGTASSGMRAVRFFHEQDAAAAARLAGRLGRGWAIQDFRGMDPQPPPQTLEVWVPDR